MSEKVRSGRTSETDGLSESTVCTECEGELLEDESRGEVVCQDCGLVHDENKIDPGPDWRNYPGENDSSRASPTTKLRHDDGLTTEISWKDKDSKGKILDSGKKRQMNRLRKWQSRSKMSGTDRNISQANGEIQRMGSALGIPKDVQETAAVLYRRATEEELVPGRSIEGMSTACLYAAARMHNVPRPMDKVANVSRVTKNRFQRSYQKINKNLELSIEPVRPQQYIGQFRELDDFDEETERIAREMCEMSFNSSKIGGRSPTCVAGAAVYAAGVVTNSRTTQRSIANVGNVTEVSIRNIYRELLRLWDGEKNDDTTRDARMTKENDGFTCGICDGLFESAHGLRVHKSLVHDNKTSVKNDSECDKCEQDDISEGVWMELHNMYCHQTFELNTEELEGMLEEAGMSDKICEEVVRIADENHFRFTSVDIASAIYLAHMSHGIHISQKNIANTFNIAASSISNRYRDFR